MGRVKGSHDSVPTHSKNAFPSSVSLTFIHGVSLLRGLCAISSHPMLSSTIPVSFLHASINTSPSFGTSSLCNTLSTPSHALSDLHWLYSIFYSSPYRIPFSPSICRVGIIDLYFFPSTRAVVTFPYRHIRIS